MNAPRHGKLTKLLAAFSAVGDKLPINLQDKFPRIAEKVEELWGTREAMPYLDSLLLSDRDDRNGFNEEVLREITYLKQLHEYEFPEISRDPFDPFSSLSFTLTGLLDTTAEKTGLSKASQETTDRPRESKETGTKPAASTLALPEERVPWGEIYDPGQLRQIVDERRKGLNSPAKDPRRIGEILVGNGLLRPEMLARALKLQKLTRDAHVPLGHILVHNGVVVAADLTFGLCQQAGIPILDPVLYPVDHEAEKRVPADVAHARMAVPVALFQNVLFLAVEDPFSFADRKYFSFLTNLNVELVATSKNKLLLRLNAYGQARSTQEADKQFRLLAKKGIQSFTARNGTAQSIGVENRRITEEDSTIVGLVNKMVSDAAAMGASDIHLEAFYGRPQVLIRFRRDGVMEVYSEYPAAYHEAVVSRIKIMSDLDISERRKPQDGKISFPMPRRQHIDLRVVTVPTANGVENLTIRLLQGGEPLPIDRIGLAERDLVRLRGLVAHPYGLFLVCGPTGSGKTTTLHSVLRELNTEDRKIWTAEDPIEIVQSNICQVQVNRKIDWTFAAALRTFLRADPDVIMIGEMRDVETAHIAVEASMTGHLVLSTLHTNSASETAARLLDLGIDPFNLSDAILGILAQRLARSICASCGTEIELRNQDLYELAAEYFFSVYQRTPSLTERDAIISNWHKLFARKGKLFMRRANGCGECNKTGYRGRTAIFELLVVTPAVRTLIRNNASVGDFLKVAVAEGMRTLKQDGIEKILLGKTDLLQVRGACV